MLSAIVLFTTSLLAGFAAAQTNSSFDPLSIPLTQRNQWCNGERNSCPKLCGGPSFLDSNGNTCDGATLKYECKCSNGTAPANIDQYLDTLPNYICQATFAQCNKNTPGSSECKECGTLKVADVQPSSSSSSAAATSTGGGDAAAATGGAPAATTGAAGSVRVPGMGMGMGAVMGFGALML